MTKLRKTIQDDLEHVRFEIWQDRPYTAARARATFNGTDYAAVGFSKVCWPDWWNPAMGCQIAKGKAVAKIARQIEEEERESWRRDANSSAQNATWTVETAR